MEKELASLFIKAVNVYKSKLAAHMAKRPKDVPSNYWQSKLNVPELTIGLVVLQPDAFNPDPEDIQVFSEATHKHYGDISLVGKNAGKRFKELCSCNTVSGLKKFFAPTGLLKDKR